MSCVVLTGVRQDAKLGPVLCLSGADLMDGTPVFDIKPYLPYSDCFPDARAGFTALAPDLLLDVDFPPELLAHTPEAHRSALLGRAVARSPAVLSGRSRAPLRHGLRGL